LLRKLKPDIFAATLLDIPLDELKKRGIKGLVIDLDNTLTKWNSCEINPEIYSWLKELKEMDFRICIVSNNDVGRLRGFMEDLQIPYISNAFKPGKSAFVKAMQLLNSGPAKTAVIGDQLFTDILGGKRLGCFTILVTPLSQREFIGTKIMRKIERLLLKKMLQI